MPECRKARGGQSVLLLPLPRLAIGSRARLRLRGRREQSGIRRPAQLLLTFVVAQLIVLSRRPRSAGSRCALAGDALPGATITRTVIVVSAFIVRLLRACSKRKIEPWADVERMVIPQRHIIPTLSIRHALAAAAHEW